MFVFVEKLIKNSFSFSLVLVKPKKVKERMRKVLKSGVLKRWRRSAG